MTPIGLTKRANTPTAVSQTPSTRPTNATRGAGSVTVEDHHGPSFPCGPSDTHRAASETAVGHFVDWTPDGRQLIFDDGMAVMVVDASGTRLQRIVDANPARVAIYKEHLGWHADISPDGQRIVYASCEYRTEGFHPHPASVYGTSERWEYHYEIATIGIDGSDPRRLTENAYIDHVPAWSPDGRRVTFLSGEEGGGRGNYTALRIETLDGSPTRGGRDLLDDGLWTAPRGAWPSPVCGAQPFVGFRCPTRPGGIRLPPSEARRTRVLRFPPQWSPDGRRVAFQALDTTPSASVLYTVAADGSDLRRVSETVGAVSWSPDGQRLALPRPGDDGVFLITIAADGSDQRTVALIREDKDRPSQTTATISPLSWSPDGGHILYRCGLGVCVVDLAGRLVGQSPNLAPDDRVWLKSRPLGKPAAAWSPDGTRIAVRTAGNQTPNGDVVLYTMAPDMSDIRVLVRGGRGMVAEHSDYQDVAAGIESCSQSFVVPDPANNPGLVHDCETLMGLRNALAGDMSRNPQVWKWAHPPELWTGPVILNWSPGTPLHQWTGVQVGGSPPRVIGLELQPREGINHHGTHYLAGTLPPELGQLTHLETLDVSGNPITGGIPPELGKLTRLRTLNLVTGLKGEIPPQLGQLTNLQALHLPPGVTGHIPTELHSLTKLRKLTANWRELVGCMPPQIVEQVGNPRDPWGALRPCEAPDKS